jgi:dihydroflavonol-4-reductase
METGLNIVDVRDVARGHLLAFEHGCRGERYILGGEDMTLKQMLDILGDITGLPSPTAKVPHGVALAYAAVEEFVSGKLLKREPGATVDEVRMGKKYMWVSSAKAERELGYTHGSAREALRCSAEWFVANGYAPAYAEMCAHA